MTAARAGRGVRAAEFGPGNAPEWHHRLLAWPVPRRHVHVVVAACHGNPLALNSSRGLPRFHHPPLPRRAQRRAERPSRPRRSARQPQYAVQAGVNSTGQARRDQSPGLVTSRLTGAEWPASPLQSRAFAVFAVNLLAMPGNGDAVLPRLRARRIGVGRLAGGLRTDAHGGSRAPEPPLWRFSDVSANGIFSTQIRTFCPAGGYSGRCLLPRLVKPCGSSRFLETIRRDPEGIVHLRPRLPEGQARVRSQCPRAGKSPFDLCPSLASRRGRQSRVHRRAPSDRS